MNSVINYILSLSRASKSKIILVNDFLIAFTISCAIAEVSSLPLTSFLIVHLSFSFIIILIFYFLNIYSNQLKYLSNKALLEIFYVFISLFSFVFLLTQLSNFQLPHIYNFLSIYFFFIIVSRLLAQSLFYKSVVRLKNVIIYGAGASGNKLYKSLTVTNPEYNVVAFIDDDEMKQSERIDSIKIFHPNKINDLKEKFNCYGVFIALPSIDSERKKTILLDLIDKDLVIKIVPSVKSIVEKNSNFSDIKNIKIEDVIGRESVSPIKELLEKNIKDKVVLITGAGGSIGSELLNQVSKLSPSKVIAIDMSEINLFNLKNSLKDHSKTKFILANLTDIDLIKSIVENYKPYIIFHAAAYKHVTLVEENVLSAVMNNIKSTYFISKLAKENKAEHFVLVSTDKAVRPSNYMGKSKLITEIIVNKVFNDAITNLSIVRFGNVLNSSGSVLQIFEKQVKRGGPLTVTGKDVTRFFMSIPEAAQLIIQSSAIESNNNTFILEMGDSYNIYDLAKKIIKINGFSFKENEEGSGISIKITGLQPGEKVHEELALNSANLKPTIHPKINSTKEIQIDFDISEWFNRLIEFYTKNDLQEYKKLIDELIKLHQKKN